MTQVTLFDFRIATEHYAKSRIRFQIIFISRNNSLNFKLLSKCYGIRVQCRIYSDELQYPVDFERMLEELNIRWQCATLINLNETLAYFLAQT